MKVISLNCNHCGAPLEVPAKARFVTCGFCEARLSIEHTGNTYSTSVLDELKQTAEQIARDVAELKSNSEIQQLDGQWEQTRRQHLITHKSGQQSLPTKSGAAFAGIAIGTFGIFWTIMAFQITSAGSRMGAPGATRIFPLFGLIFVAFGVFTVFRSFTKADAYQKDQKKYRDQRRRLFDEPK